MLQRDNEKTQRNDQTNPQKGRTREREREKTT
jgi:hypothetical protein